MQVVISVNPCEGMCRLDMKLHGYVLINAISFHRRWLLWHFVPSKRGDKTYQFCLCQIKGWYTAPLSRRGIDARLRACEPATEDSLTSKKWQKHSQALLGSSAGTCKGDRDGALRIVVAPVSGWAQTGLDQIQTRTQASTLMWYIDVISGLKSGPCHVTVEIQWKRWSFL